MNQCQNCGRVNNFGSNFCRFCGTKFQVNQISNDAGYEQSPPRPYSWKTDEFQIAEAPPRPKPRTINQVQSPPFQYPTANQPPRPIMRQQPPSSYQQPLVYQNQQQSVANGFNCPRCAGQAIKYERKISTAGWIVFAVLMVVFFPLFWIGLMLKEDVRVCLTCNFRLS